MRIAALLSAVLVLACGGTSAPRTQYLLRAQPTERAGRVEAPVRIGLDRVVVAPYLDQNGIVVETAAGEVQAARQHQWAEPLEAGLRSYLRAAISAALGYDVSAGRAERMSLDYTVDVYVDRLHGTMAGSAVIDASYHIEPRSGGVVEYRFSRTTTLPRDGYAGLVEAETALVRQLADAIAQSLRAMSGNP